MIDEKAIEKAVAEYGKAQVNTCRTLGISTRLPEIDFRNGVKWAISELTRWRDPEKERPDKNCDYLGKFKRADGAEFYQVVTFSERWGFATAWGSEEILGWRPI